MEYLKVLIVDDEPGIRSGINRILRNHTIGFPFLEEDFAFEILEAETGEEAVDILEKTGIDIILLDNKLPGMDGIHVLEHIKAKGYDSSVMMITSYASLDLAIKATNNGAYNFMPKPFTPQDLKASMESITKHLYLKRMTRTMKEEARKARFQFLSVLSHELKSPINAIEGYLRIMQEKQAGPGIDEYLPMIERSLERIRGMRTLIRDMLDLTRYESGTKKRNMEMIDLVEVAHNAIGSIEPLARQKGVKIFFDSPDQLLLWADRSEIEIIYNNLLSNAVKYNRDGGQVFFSLSDGSDRFILRVEDTGIGMSSEEAGSLFREFVRIRNGKTRDISGSGLGLSIARKFVELYHGEISVESEPEKGSVFTATLLKRATQGSRSLISLET